MDPRQADQLPPDSPRRPSPQDPPQTPTSEPDFEPLTDDDIPDQPIDGDPSAYVSDDQVGEDGTRFEPLDGGLSASPKTPFSDEEILDGSAMISMLLSKRFAGAPIHTERDVETFKAAYAGLFAPFVSTVEVIKPLQLGEALAHYGIHKNMAIAGVGLDDVHPLIRLGIGALLLGTSTVLAIGAVRENADERAPRPQQPQRDPRNTDPADHTPEAEPPAPRADDDAPAQPREPEPAGGPPENGTRPGQAWA